jgi:hypothetical protein
MNEPIWYSDPSILFSSGTWQRFVPTKDMDVPTALNAVVRFTVYFAVLLYACTSKHEYLLAIPLVLVVSAIFSSVFPKTRPLIESFHTVVKHLTHPTAKNPFMNPLLTEILDNPDRPDAAPITDKAVKQEIEKAFQQTEDMYMDTSDRFDMAQSMRTFHTLQSATIPTDQDGFLKFLAKNQDAVDTSSAFPARNAKLKSETYVQAQGSLGSLPNSTSKPTGVTPTKASTKM